jgi:starch phosphorylase
MLVAYLSMEIALENNIKTYAGGLGVLAGDVLRSAARKKFPMVAVTILNKQGYFKQKISSSGSQIERIDRDYDFSNLKKLETEVTINIGHDSVKIGVWEYLIKSEDGFAIPVYLLDADVAGNKLIYKKLTSKLYGGNLEARLQQEMILGRGGVKMLAALGYKDITIYHMNEGHGAFAAIELFNTSQAVTSEEKAKDVKQKCVFTTHTPIKTVYDSFPLEMILKNQPDFPCDLAAIIKDNQVDTLELGIYFSRYINGVSLAHQALLNNIFPGVNFKAITNGVNSIFWTSPEFKKIYDKYLTGWRDDYKLLARATDIPTDEIWRAHQENKKLLLEYIKVNKKIEWQEEIFTICFARRFTGYKQPLLLLSDIERLLEISEKGEKIQIIFAGKAHIRDIAGQDAIKKINQIRKKYPRLKLVFLENYNLDLAHLLVAGSDVWLNNPLPPQEACGTSGMKAAHNGVPQISTLDGWWPEGFKLGKTGWAIKSADDLYEILKREVLPLYYQKPEAWREIMRNTIAINAAYFNSDRMLDQYIKEAS